MASGQVQVRQHAIEHAVVLVEDPLPYGRGRKQRDEPRQEKERTQETAQRELALEVESQAQTDRELSDDRSDGEDQRVACGPTEDVRVKDGAIVREPRPR